MLKTISSYRKKWFAGAILILLLSLSLHLPFFGQLPSGLNRDETALGYNAYSLLKTGKDEWGKSWPISITSFGDQKLPGYIYTLIPFIATFGLETWVIRLPSLLASLVIILSMGLIAHSLAKTLKLSEKSQLSLSLITMLLIAISPWQMHFSRVAYETHLAMAFFLVGVISFLSALNNHVNKEQRTLLIVTGIFFALAMLTYHSYQIFIPLFALFSLGIFNKKLLTLDKIGLTVAIFSGLVAVILLFQGGVIQANQVKSIGTSPFSKQSLLLSAVEYRETNQLPLLINKLLFNRFTEGVIKFCQNYLTTFSGLFFFVHGSGHGDHNPGQGNNLHLFLAPFIFLGFLCIWSKNKNSLAKLIIFWLFLALVPSSLTINPLLEVRIATVFPVLELLAALGIIYVLSFFRDKWQIFVSFILIAIAIFSALRLVVFYTVIAPRSAVDNHSYHQLAKILFKYQSQADVVLTQSPSSSPYIWYLFENKIDPNLVQKELIHYPATDEGFMHVQKFANVHFEIINWPNLTHEAQGKNYVLVLKPNEISNDQKINHNFQFLEAILNQNEQVIYEIWQYSPKI